MSPSRMPIPAPDPLSLKMVGNDIVVSTHTETNNAYQLQTMVDLAVIPWSNAGPSISGTANIMAFPDPNAATNHAGFYRIETTP